MLIHNVYFWLQPDTPESERKAFEKGMKTFLDAVDEVQKYHIGVPAATPKRDVVEHSFGYSMFVWFNSVEEHNTYQSHPGHDVFIETYKHLWAKVQVLDSEKIG